MDEVGGGDDKVADGDGDGGGTIVVSEYNGGGLIDSGGVTGGGGVVAVVIGMAAVLTGARGAELAITIVLSCDGKWPRTFTYVSYAVPCSNLAGKQS